MLARALRRGFVVVLIATLAGLVVAGQAASDTFSNTGVITIPVSGTANPYPSTIAISGLTHAITDVNVTLHGFSHTFPFDLGVLLVGPTKASVVLMGRNGLGNSVSNLTITYDDAAASSIDCNLGDFVSGTFKPADCLPNLHPFASPAPAGPWGTLLSVFNGTNANGTWSLFVQDFANPDGGSIAGGWTLTITAAGALAVTVSSLTATRTQKGVVVRWRTGTEKGMLGFNVYRQQGARRIRLNRRLLPALGSFSGRSYSFLDRRALAHRAVRYWLQDVSTSATRTWHGPVQVAAA